MRNLGLYLGLGAAALGLAGVVWYASHVNRWEKSQPLHEIRATVVYLIQDYSATNDLHTSLRGKRITVDKEEGVQIDFHLTRWNPEISQGDTVNVVVRASYPHLGQEPQLDGISIEHYVARD